MEIGQFYITNDLPWMEAVLLLHAENTQAILNDHVQIGPVTGVEAFKSLNIGCRNTSTVTTMRKFEADSPLRSHPSANDGASKDEAAFPCGGEAGVTDRPGGWRRCVAPFWDPSCDPTQQALHAVRCTFHFLEDP